MLLCKRGIVLAPGSRCARTKNWPHLYFDSLSHDKTPGLDEICYMYPTSHILLHASTSRLAMASLYSEEERWSVSQRLEARQGSVDRHAYLQYETWSWQMKHALGPIRCSQKNTKENLQFWSNDGGWADDSEISAKTKVLIIAKEMGDVKSVHAWRRKQA
jgi:hypothetical protein